jgi:AP2 domain
MKESKTPEETAPLEVTDRVDRGRFHGWVVRGWKNGEKLKRDFAEESYTSPSMALVAAVRFRDSLVSGGDDWSPSKRATGIPGISIGRVRTAAGRYVKHYTVSVYGADGKRRVKVFSWLKYGKERAPAGQERPEGGEGGGLACATFEEAGEKAGRGGWQSPFEIGYCALEAHRAQERSARGPSLLPRLRRVAGQGRVTPPEILQRRSRAGPSRLSRARPRIPRRHAREASSARPDPSTDHNSTGIPGVSLVNDRTRSGRVVQRFVAHWYNADGRREKRSFSTLEHGFAGAESKAIRARNAGLAKLFRERKAMLLEELDERKQRRKKWQESRPNVSPPF